MTSVSPAVAPTGAAGMPDFTGDATGLLTRIAIDIDARSWRARFEAPWPAGSDTDASCIDRIVRGPAHDPADAVRDVG